jgi:hypothetical protein
VHVGDGVAELVLDVVEELINEDEEVFEEEELDKVDELDELFVVDDVEVLCAVDDAELVFELDVTEELVVVDEAEGLVTVSDVENEVNNVDVVLTVILEELNPKLEVLLEMLQVGSPYTMIGLSSVQWVAAELLYP